MDWVDGDGRALGGFAGLGNFREPRFGAKEFLRLPLLGCGSRVPGHGLTEIVAHLEGLCRHEDQIYLVVIAIDSLEACL